MKEMPSLLPEKEGKERLVGTLVVLDPTNLSRMVRILEFRESECGDEDGWEGEV